MILANPGFLGILNEGEPRNLGAIARITLLIAVKPIDSMMTLFCSEGIAVAIKLCLILT